MIIGNVALLICSTLLTSGGSIRDCSDMLAIAQLESSFNPKAVGSLGERGLFQVRPEYHGKVPKDIEGQTKQAWRVMRKIRAVCQPSLAMGWFVCYNRGVTGGLKRGRGTVYEATAIKYAKTWLRVLNDNKQSILSATRRSHGVFGAKDVLTAQANY